MPKSSNTAPNGSKKGRGRQSDFSGEKEAYLDSLRKDFPNRKDRSAFYDEAAQGLIDKFGYSRDGRTYVEADNLSDQEKLEYYQTLRSKMGQWFRHRNLGKSSDRSYVAEIVNSIKSAASVQPRKRSALSIYIETNKDKLSSEFAVHWSAVQNDLSQKKRLPKYNEFVQACWKKEPQAYRDEIEKEALIEHEKANREWKEKIESFNGTAEEFERAWGMAESVLPSFADGIAEWLGAQVIIIAVSPDATKGEITMQSVQSDCSKGQMKSLLPQFDEKGWKKLQEMVITYGKGFFSGEERKRRIVARGVDLLDAELGEDDGVGLENGDCGGNEYTGDGEGDKNNKVVHTPGDGDEPDQEEDDRGPSKEMEINNACDPKPDEKSTTVTDHPTTLITAPCPEQNKLSPTAHSMNINGEKGTPLALHPSTPTVPIQDPQTLDPYSSNFSLPSNWPIPSQSSNESLNFTPDFFFGNKEIPSSLKSSNADSFTDGSFLNALYEPLDASLVPSFPYTSPGANLEIPGHSITVQMNPYGSQNANLAHTVPLAVPNNPYPIQGTNLEFNSQAAGVTSNPYYSQANVPAQSDTVSFFQPYIPPVTNAFSQHAPSELRAPAPDSGGFPLFPPHISLPDPGNASDEGTKLNKISDSGGQKRKGDEAGAILTKRRCLKGTENLNVEMANDPKESGGEETGISGETKERAGKPTMSGRVPLMPAHLAEGGYQGEKKGVRGRKQPANKPKSRGYTRKPSSKGATKIPVKKNGNSKQ